MLLNMKLMALRERGSVDRLSAVSFQSATLWSVSAFCNLKASIHYQIYQLGKRMSECVKRVWLHPRGIQRKVIKNEEGHNKQLYSSKTNAFCNHTKEEIMNCKCGEEEKDFAWVWSADKENGQAGSIVLGLEQRQVNFNPEYSSGTAAVRGMELLPTGCHHYWELKMTSAVYGTNIMVGVCTPKCDMKLGIHRFCSLLGRDKESWGYSYTGTIQHEGKFQRYGPRWGKGSIVGIHLDSWRGTLEFYLNREPLGIAFTGLHNKELYPIITSTSAHSGMKLVSSYMFPHSLQFLASNVVFNKIFKDSNIDPEQLPLPPGLHAYVLNNYWPFIKYGFKGASNDSAEDLKVCNTSKRPLNDKDLLDMNPPKRLYSYHMYNFPVAEGCHTELASGSHSSGIYPLESDIVSLISHHLPSSVPSSSSRYPSKRASPTQSMLYQVPFASNSTDEALPTSSLLDDGSVEVQNDLRPSERDSVTKNYTKHFN